MDAPVERFGLDENAIPIVPTGEDAAHIIAWYDFSAQPGTGSHAVFAGHVTWNGAAVFKKLGTVAVGDTVQLRGTNGAEATYRVTSTLTFEANDPNALDVMKPTPNDSITLITCVGVLGNKKPTGTPHRLSLRRTQLWHQAAPSLDREMVH